ncbi:MAG: ABC transporter ATP-binding protein/permease [Clostridiales bacterium]|jgi:ATP-binding cassette subfamily B protein|nr:ABC transporter ATP-binding protein/permease [Clostridiales bacterium]
MSQHKKEQSTQPPIPTMRGAAMMSGPMGVVKAKNFKGTWAKLIKYCKPFIPTIIIAALCAMCGMTLLLIGPKFFGKITDEIGKVFVVGSIDLDVVFTIGYFLIVGYFFSFIFRISENMLTTKITQKISKQMRTDLASKINRLPLGFFHSTSYGDVLSRVTNDVDSVGSTLNQSISQLSAATTMFVGSTVMMFTINWIMAVVAVFSSLFGFVFIRVITKKSQKFFKAQQRDLGGINGQIEEIYTGHTVVKAYNASAGFKKTFEEVNDRLYDSAWKSQFFSGLMMPLMGFILNLNFVVICVTGSILVMNGMISFGVVASFIIYVRMFNMPLSQFAQVATQLQMTAAASERVFEFLEQDELDDESQKTDKFDTVKGSVEFSHVKFGYQKDKLVINNFNALIQAGHKVAIVGPTGAGKTTIVNLLMRFYELNDGQILIDGVPIDSVKREFVHDLFDMVLQDSWLFEGTIRENIVFSQTGVSEQQVVEACKTVGLHRFIMTLKNGYDTILDDRASLSEGQKQLLTIARAIIKDAPLLILDEATSSVDTRTERIVQEAMDRLTQGRTSFVIAHRLSTIKNADMILVMKEGDIIENGNHNQLMDRGGFYAELYRSQFETT